MLKYIKYSLIICLGIYKPAYAAVPMQTKTYFANNGGLYDHISPLLVPDSNAGAVSNVTLDDRGQLSKRNGYLNLSTVAISTYPITGGGYHTAASGSSFFGIVVGTDVYRTGNTFAGVYTKVTSTVALTAGSSNLAQTTSINDNLVFCNELDKPFYMSSTGNAVMISTGLFTGAKTCATYGSYLVLANLTESAVAYPSRVRWSNIQDTNNFPANNFIDVEPNDGDKIVSVISFNDSVYIFKKRSIYRMVITGLDGADAFIIRPVVRNIGAWAKNSVKVIPNVGIVFLAQNTVYVLSDSGLTPIGDSIQRTLDGVTRSMWANAVGAVYPKRYQYWLAVSTSSDSQNHEALVYDYVQRGWTVYSGTAINMLAQAEDSTGQNILTSGDYVGFHYKQDVGVADFPGGVSNPIAATYTTSNNAFSSPDITKNFKYLYIFSLVDSTTSVDISAAYDYNNDYEYAASVDLGTAPAVYDVAIYDVDIYPAAGYRVTRLELNRSARAMRLRFSNSSANSALGILGWTVVYNLEDWKE